MQKLKAQVAERIKERRLEMSVSQDVLGKCAGVDRKTINRIENGHFSPSMDTFFRLCIALDVQPGNILKS